MRTTIQQIPFKTITGGDASLADYAGKVLVIVNVASKCGLTPQYEGLQSLYAKYKARGLIVLGFPANDFAGQEPGSNAQIADFCTLNYAVEFPMFEKIAVAGPNKHPLYAALTIAAPAAQGDAAGFREQLRGFGMTPSSEPEVLWNFEKFLIGRKGAVVARFAPTTPPDDPAFVARIEAELAN